MKGEKCHFCKYDCGPLKGKPDACVQCDHFSNFKVKNRMTDLETHMYSKLIEEEEWIRDNSAEFDRDTALAVLKAISKHMHVSHDIFGNPTLVINRYRFEAVRKKFLDRKTSVSLIDGHID